MGKPDARTRLNVAHDHPPTRDFDLVERLARTPILTPFDYDQEGKQDGFLRLYYSGETNGYGYIPIPVICIRNGEGPTAILFGGNHGNEYEGIVGLMGLARDLEVRDVRGRVIIIPSLNYPAVMAGTRASPLDGGNLNRSFPGSPSGSPTQVLAHYVSTVLIPLADVVIDLHAGGRSAHFVPCAIVHEGRDPHEAEKLAQAAEWFGAPFSFVSAGKGRGGSLTLAGECMRQGVMCLTAELGGGETMSSQGLALACYGVRRVLNGIGILTFDTVPAAAPTRWVRKGPENRLHAHVAGIFEPRISLGDTVAAGQLAGLIHFHDLPMAQPDEVRFEVSGSVLSLHIPALVARGDELCTVVSDVR